MSTTTENLQHAARLVKQWGNAQLPNGRTLRDVLTVSGVSLWQVVEPVLAVSYVPAILIRKTAPSLRARLEPWIAWVKYKRKAHFGRPQRVSSCPPWPKERTGLLLGFSSYMYRDVLEPMTHCSAGDTQCNYVTLTDPGRHQTAVTNLSDGQSQSIWKHWTPAVAAQELQLRRELAAVLKYVEAAGVCADISSACKMSLRAHLDLLFKSLLTAYLPALLPYLTLAQHILQTHRPSIIVSPDVTDPRTRCFCLGGRLCAIPSLEVQFGLYYGEAVEWQFFVADRVAVWGEAARRVLAEHGVPDKRISVTGSARFDGMYGVRQADADPIRARLEIPHGRRIILFASTYSFLYFSKDYNFHAILASVKRAVFKASDKLDGFRLVVKPHPLERGRDLEELAKEFQNVIVVDPALDIRELIKACDVFITLGSTATMEALLLRKLVLFPAFPWPVWSEDLYLNNQVALVARSEDELVRHLHEVSGGKYESVLDELEPARQRFLQDWVYQADGQAANRIAALAQKMAEQGYRP